MVGMMIGKICTGILESKSVQLALIVGIVTGVLGICGIWFGGYNKILPILFGGGLIYGFIYAFVTTLLPYLTRQIFGDLHYDKIYSVILIPVNLVGAFAASGLALVNQMFGWDFFFILDIVVMILIYIFCTLCYNAGKRDAQRSLFWHARFREISFLFSQRETNLNRREAPQRCLSFCVFSLVQRFVSFWVCTFSDHAQEQTPSGKLPALRVKSNSHSAKAGG